MPTPRRRRSTPTLAEVDQALAEVRRLYRIGQQSLLRHPERMPAGVINREAHEAGLNLETMRKARGLAQPATGYAPRQFEALCREARTQRYPLPVGVLVRLLAVPKPDRPEIQKRAIREGWTRRQLDQLIRQRYGQRRQGGRYMTEAANVDESYAQLEQLAQQWLRHSHQLAKGDKEETGAPGLKDLTPATRKRVGEVDQAMWAMLRTLRRRQARGRDDASS